MRKTIGVVNHWAEKSCPRWNSSRASRYYYRQKYQKEAERHFKSKAHQRLVEKYQSGKYEVDTYPWPYRAPTFADWYESSEDEDYSLVPDQSGFVVKHAASYVSYKIFEYTGTWPKRRDKEFFDAWNWQEFLRQAGYRRVATLLSPNKRYVGILKATDWNKILYSQGLVVWAEKVIPGIWQVIVSTYTDKRHRVFSVAQEDYDWIEIVGPMCATA